MTDIRTSDSTDSCRPNRKRGHDGRFGLLPVEHGNGEVGRSAALWPEQEAMVHRVSNRTVHIDLVVDEVGESKFDCVNSLLPTFSAEASVGFR